MNRLVIVAATVMGLAFSSLPAAARDEKASVEPVIAIWHRQRISVEYHSFDVSYSCSSLQRQLGAILKAVGAHDDIEVQASCDPDSLVSSAVLMVTLKTAVVASEANIRAATTYTAEQELVARLHGVRLPTPHDLPRFNAEWRTVSLGHHRKLRLSSGDCDLLTTVHEQLLPKLGLATRQFDCYSSGRRARPKFKVAALLPVGLPAMAVSAPHATLGTEDE